MANDNAIINMIERTVRKFSAVEDEGYEIQKMIEREQNKNNVFGFWGATEGVGTTTAVVNIASELAKVYSVCIVDLNMLKPDVFRYLCPDMELNKKTEPKSIREKIINPTIPIAEFIIKTKNPNISILTALFSEHPSVYCETDTTEAQEKRIIDTYIGIFRELATLYDFVLLDIDTNIIDVSSIAAFRSCDNVITFIGHSMKCYEYTIKTVKVFNEMGLYGIFNNVVQTMICNEAWKEEEMQSMNPNLHLLTNLPFSMDVHSVGANLDIFVECNRSQEKNPVLYRNGIKQIAADICQMAKESELQHAFEEDEAKRNASIITEGIFDYINEQNINLDDIEISEEDFILQQVAAGSHEDLVELSFDESEDDFSVDLDVSNNADDFDVSSIDMSESASEFLEIDNMEDFYEEENEKIRNMSFDDNDEV